MSPVYEPPSGWNLPPGCFEGDPRAPWNEPDCDPDPEEEPGTCEDCRHWWLALGMDDGLCLVGFDPARHGDEGALAALLWDAVRRPEESCDEWEEA